MKVAIPKQIAILSTNIPASTESEWVPGTYAKDAIVKITTSEPHKLYISPVDNNSTDPEAVDSTWGEPTATNQWKMFDKYVMSQSVGGLTIDDGKIIVKIGSSRCDKLGLLMLDCASISISMDSNGTEVFTKEIDLDESIATTPYSYTYREFTYRQDYVLEIPLYTSSEVTITLTPISGGIAKCGHVVVGKDLSIGSTVWDVEPGMEDFSRVSENTFGESYLSPGNYAKTITAQCNTYTAEISRMKREVERQRATPLLWDFNNPGVDIEALIVFGFYKSARPRLKGLIMSGYSFEIRGMI